MRLAILTLFAMGAQAAAPLLETAEVFHAGAGGYFIYRIPAVLVSPRGTLLAFAEARKDSAHDESDTDVVLKRSRDGGKTWSAMQLLADHGKATIGNPCPVVDRKTGAIFLLLTENPADVNRRQLIDSVVGTRTVWIMRSTDDGATWTKPVEITSSVKDPDWGWYATGPGVGIQLADGRMVIPCNHRMKGQTTPYSHVIFSDDHGATWKLGGTVGANTNESQVVELADGSLMINARSYEGKSRRAVSISRDAGMHWSPVRLDETLVEPVCQGSILRLTGKPAKNRLLFSNPADTKERKNETVRLSYDDGKTWPVAKTLNAGPSGYSSLVVLPDNTIGCFYEKIAGVPDYTLVFARFNLEWLTGGEDHLP